MTIEIGFGWIVLLLAIAALAYGIKGIFWTIVGFVVGFFVVLPIVAVVLAKKGKAKKE